MKTTRLTHSLLMGLILLAPFVAQAISGTSQVAWEGKPVEDRKGWPRGAVQLINDPLRIDGWNPWFSELPNATDYYEMQIRNMEDVNHLLAQLAKIQAPKLEVLLDSRKQAEHLGYVTSVKKEKQVGAVLAIGDQDQMDQWSKAEKQSQKASLGIESKSRVDLVSVDQFTHHSALPPTLTLYVGHPAVDLEKLHVPPNIAVRSGVADWYRKEHGASDPWIKAIDAFIAKAGTNSIQPTLPDLSEMQASALVKEAHEAFRKLVQGDPNTRGDNIPSRFWGPTITGLKPLRVLNDRVNIKIVMSEWGAAETGFYVHLTISSFIPPREDYLEFVPLRTAEDKTPMGQIYRYKAARSQPAHK